MIRIDLITNGCDKCIDHRDEPKAVAHDVIGDGLEWRDLSVLDELDVLR